MRLEEGDRLADFFLGAHALVHEAMCVEDGAVIATTEGFTDFREGRFGEFAREIHGDLAREGDVLRATLACHIGDADVEVLGDFSLDEIDGDSAFAFLVKDILEQMLDGIGSDLGVAKGDEGGDAHERTLEAADVGADALGKELEDTGLELDGEGLGFFAENRETRLDVGRLKLGGQTPFEAGDEALLEIGDFRRRAVAGEDDLLVPIEECVEGVEEFLLGTFLAGEELDIVDEEEISLAIALAKFDEGIVLDGIDELVGEFLRREIHHLATGAALGDLLADGLHEMGLAETDAAIDEEGVISAGRRLGDSEGGGVGELVVGADDEGGEGVARIHATCDGGGMCGFGGDLGGAGAGGCLGGSGLVGALARKGRSATVDGGFLILFHILDVFAGGQ